MSVVMKNIVKEFGTFRALDDISLSVEKGTIHALLGENGAGKSTLMNILYGLYNADSGEITINGKKVNIKNPNVAIELGIGMVHQHFMLVEPMTVTQNIILGSEVIKKGKLAKLFGILDIKKAKEDISKLSEKYGLSIDPDAKIEDISVGMQQRVEILKALYRGAEILILDEPTAVLTPQEIDELIKIMRNLTESGKTIIIITHKLKEIKQSSDKCTIIRRGKYIDTVAVKDVSEVELASMMVGRDVKLHIEKDEANPQDIIFNIENLVVSDYRGTEKLKSLNLSVRRGEILGIAGIDGNGQKELVEAIMCLTNVKSGIIEMNGKQIQNTSPKNVMENKIAAIHEDRHKRGLVLSFTTKENSVLNNFYKDPFSKKHILQFEEIEKHCNSLVEKYDVRPNTCANLPIRALSGGNQQKLIIGREVENAPDLLIAVQPTRGLDVGAIEFVHKSLIEQRDRGKAVLLISLELEEVMDVSDTIAVLYDGQIVEVMKNENIDDHRIGLLMAGGGEK